MWIVLDTLIELTFLLQNILLSFHLSVVSLILLPQGILPPVQRTILEILPLLRPSDHISTAWSVLLEELLCYLLGSEVSSHRKKDDESATNINSGRGGAVMGSFTFTGTSSTEIAQENRIKSCSDVSDDSVSTSIVVIEPPPSLPSSEAISDETTICSWNHLFMEKLIPIIIELFQKAPSTVKCNIFPETIKGLGR